MSPDRLTPEIASRDPHQIWEYLIGLMQKHSSHPSGDDGLHRFLHQFPRGIQLAYWLVIVNSDILNGGILALFWNHTLWEVEQMLAALGELGAVETALQVRRVRDCLEMEIDPRTGRDVYGQVRDPQAEATIDAICNIRCTD